MSDQKNLEHQTHEIKHSLIALFCILTAFALAFEIGPLIEGFDFFYIYFSGFTIVPGILLVYSVILYSKFFKHKHSYSKTFALFTLGIACWFIAEQIWQLYDYVWLDDPFPSEADIFYIASYPLLTIFLFLSIKPVIKSASRNVWLFSIGLSLALLIPSISTAYDDIFEENAFSVSIALAYPIMSSIQLIPAIIGVLLLTKQGANFSWVLFLFGFIIYAIADTLFLFAEIEGTFYDSHLANLLFVFVYVFLIFAVQHSIKFVDFSADKKHALFFTYNVNFENISKFGIPLTIIISSLVIFLSVTDSIFVQEEEEIIIDNLIFAVIGITITFVLIVFIINRNLSNLIKLRTKELVKQRDNLENLVEEKTSELLKAERLSAIGELSGRLAHDLRNPLSVIKMSVDLLKQNPDETKLSDPTITKRIDLIEKSIKRISHQVDDVLDYVRNSPLQLSKINLEDTIQNSIEKINIPSDVEIKIFGKNTTIDCDPVKLDAVFINLIVNSIQAMQNGGKIEIKIHEKDNFVILEFIDSGEGIPNDDLDKVFEPLFTTKQKGTGLGLSSCKNIIEQHKGQISVKNNPTTFTIHLPKSLSAVAEINKEN